jgi:hypothetical protein
MLPRLRQLANEVAPLQSKLILLIAPPNSGKTALISALADESNAAVMNLSLELGTRLAKLPQKRRRLQAGSFLRELAEEYARGDLLLIDNIELLFDTSLEINPLDLLKRLAHARRVVAVWPGEHRAGHSESRLVYAAAGHPEHRDYPVDGVVPFFVLAQGEH